MYGSRGRKKIQDEVYFLKNNSDTVRKVHPKNLATGLTLEDP